MKFIIHAAVLAVVLALSLLTLSAPAFAQTAPAGNAHPTAKDLSDAPTELANPFGEPVSNRAQLATPQQKLEFEKAVNLEPLRGVAVFHNGRVKILDTLARETVKKITGRNAFTELLPGTEDAKGRLKTARHDPLFTLLDLIIDPVYYLDKPLVGVDYLPLRRALVEEALPGDDAGQSRLLKSGRVTPIMIDRYASKVAREHMDKEPFIRALGVLDGDVRLFLGGKANLELVAPGQRDQPWSHVSTLGADHPVRIALTELGTAWRARDAAKVNALAAQVADLLPALGPEVYPTTRAGLELAYNRSSAFEYGFWAYCLSLVSLLLAFGTGRKWLATLGTVLLFLAVGLHTFGFVARCIIAERFAIQNQFESMVGLSLFATLLGAGIMISRRQWLFGAAAAAVGFMVLVTATQTRIPGQFIEREAAILNTSVLLKYHVTTVLVSYGLIALGFIISLFYLGTHYLSRRTAATPAAGGAGGGAAMSTGGDESLALVLGQDGAGAPRAKTLADLDTAQMIILQLAFWTLGVGILLGAWWADHSWGRWWAFDPKETWALITWIVYLVVIHMRIAAPGNKSLITAWLSVIGFVVMLWTYFGVNLLLPGLHAYA